MKLIFGKDKIIVYLSLLILMGCTEWNSVPIVVDQSLGLAYHNMVKNQTLCTEHGLKAKDPKLCPEHGPVIALDGQKAKGVIDAYRQGSVTPIEDAKKGVGFDVKNVGGATTN
jgi:hypothetical protein